mgnify:CR=1 FL=1
MKIGFFNDFRLGVLKGTDVVCDVTSVVAGVPHTGPHDLISNLIARFDAYRQRLAAAAAAHEPHRIAFYLYDLASDFHALWNKGNDSPQLRFILKEDVKLTQTRLAFLQAIRYVLANGLRILGVRPAEEM